jgi:hypothetical protein
VNKITMELELVPIAEGMEHDPKYFKEELKEFFEQFGWKITYSSVEEDEE